MTKDDSSYEWICEGRHPVPTHHEDFSYKLPRYVKLRKEAPKTEKVKERKPCSTVPVSATPTNFAKATQTLTVKKEQKEEMVDEVKEEVSVSLLSNTPVSRNLYVSYPVYTIQGDPYCRPLILLSINYIN